MKQSQGINVPGALGHLLTNVRAATALFPDTLLVEELAGSGHFYCGDSWDELISFKRIL